MLKYFICIVFCSLLSVKATCESEEVSYDESPCLASGGICVRTDDCPRDKLAKTKGLCPLQQKSGIECCYSLPNSETRCDKRGGMCMKKTERCPEQLTFSKATDCTVDEKCCILVK